MMGGRSAKPGYFLTELVSVIALMALLSAIVGKVLIEGVQVQRACAQHANRMSTMDALARQLQRDVLNAGQWRWQDQTLWLGPPRPATAEAISYSFGPNAAKRLESGTETHVWESLRLRFSAELLSGTRGSLLCLTCTEERPPERTRLPDRSYPLTVLLPRCAGPAPNDVTRLDNNDEPRASARAAQRPQAGTTTAPGDSVQEGESP